jgi:predicted ribosomally synthesized peptide with SipW-like signal peptide
VLVVIVILLFALLVGGAVLTTAVFTDSSSSKGSISAGDLVFALSPTTTIVDTSGMKPGDTRMGSVTLTNQKAAGTFSLGFSGLGTGTLASTLQLTVSKSSGTTNQQLYSGVLASVPTLSLGTLATGASMGLKFTYAWPADQVDPALQGQSIPLVLQWSART